MSQHPWPLLLSVIGLVTASGCKDQSPPTWPQGAALATERAEKGLDVKLSWPAASDDEEVTGYELVRDQEPPVSLSVAQTAHTFEKLADATEHTFTLAARDAAGNWSQALTASLTIPDITPPTWPVERFQAEELQPSGKAAVFRLTWEPATDNVSVTGYLLVRETSDFEVELGPELREYGLEGEDVEGHYQLSAVDAAGNRSKPQPCSAHSRRLLNRKIAIESGILKMLAADSAKMDNVFGNANLSDRALGDLIGSNIGDAGGFGGLGMRGSGLGGGGGGGGMGIGGLGRPKEKVPGSVEPSVASTTGGIDASAFRRAIAGQRGAFKACYEKRLKQDPSISGSLELTLTLKGGQITLVDFTGGSLEDAGTRSCVRRVFRRIRLPGADGTVVTRFVFQKG